MGTGSYTIQNHRPVCGLWRHTPEVRPRLMPVEGTEARARQASRGRALSSTNSRLCQEVDQLLDGIKDAKSELGVAASSASTDAASQGVAASDLGVAPSSVGTDAAPPLADQPIKLEDIGTYYHHRQ